MFRAIIKYLLGLFIVSMGINLSIVANLGMSSVNSVPYSISIALQAPFSICVVVVYSFYVFLQYLILKKDFKWTNLMQLVCVTIFGQFVELTGYLTSTYLIAETMLMRFVALFFSISCVAFGVSLYVQANLIMLPVEGLTSALTHKFPKYSFGNIRTALDITFVITAVCIGMFFEGRILGVGIGTVISAILTGKMIGVFSKITKFI